MIPALGRSPGEGKGYPLQYSGLENSMDCMVHGSQKSQTQLNDFHFPFCCSVTQSCLTLRPHGLQNHRLPCPSPTPGACSDSCPLSQWCHPATSSCVISFSSHLQSFPASGSFPMSQFFVSGGQIVGVSASASVLPMNIQD